MRVNDYSQERKQTIKDIINIVKKEGPIEKKAVYKKLNCSSTLKGLAWKDACLMDGIYQINQTQFSISEHAEDILNSL